MPPVFSGIITALGIVAAMDSRGGGASLRIACPAGWTAGMKIGDSAAADGACLTATMVGAQEFGADLTPETLAVCAPLAVGGKINLERALSAGDEIGGHFVTGHVDGTGEVLEAEDDGAAGRRLRISFPPGLGLLVARKGSVAVSGVSLTVNRAGPDSFTAHLIPHTMAVTNLGGLRVGDRVNLEADLLARHVARILESRGG